METSNAKILIVEDDSETALYINQILKHAGYAVTGMAASGEEAVALVKENSPEIVLMDILLQGDMDGISAAGIIRSIIDIPIIYLTLHSAPELLQRAKVTEPFAYLLKPYSERELVVTIEMALYKHRKEREFIDLQAQLLQSEKMSSIGQLAAGVAHEINNPVGYISSNLGALDKYLDDLFALIGLYVDAEAAIEDAETVEQIRQLKKAIDLDFTLDDIRNLIKESHEGIFRVKKIVQDLKDFSHIDNQEWDFADIHTGIESTLNIVRNEIKYKAEVVREYGELPEIRCIASQLNQVFMNLLVNAAHAIEGHGTITIKTGIDQPEQVWVRISDTGKGIDRENLNKIFNPFFTTKPVGKGTGLGLSLSSSIVERHKGKIHVDSEVGKGTTFTVVLPVSPNEHEIAQE